MPPLGLATSLGLGAPRQATSSGAPHGGAPFANTHSVLFDATNEWVDLGTTPNGAFNNNSGDFTVSLWFNYAANVSYDTLICNGFPVQVYLTGGKVKSWLSSTESAAYFIVGATTSGSFSADTWYHLGILRSGTSFKYYINGAEDSEVTATGTTFISEWPMQVGRYSSSYYFFDGMVDEVAFWDTALTAGNIAAIYNSGEPNDLGTGGLDLEPTHWWRMGDNDGGTGTTVTDQGSGESDGSLENSASFAEDVPS